MGQFHYCNVTCCTPASERRPRIQVRARVGHSKPRIWSPTPHMSATTNRKIWTRRLALAIVAVAIIGFAALTVFVVYYQPFCGLVCGPGVYPVIQSPHIHINSRWDGNCQQMSTVAVCTVRIEGGDTGNVTLNVINENQKVGQGGNRVQFVVYASEAGYVNFTSIPLCAYTSAPKFASPSCGVPGPQAETFQFDFIVSPNYPPISTGGSFQQPASITIVMYQTCCWP